MSSFWPFEVTTPHIIYALLGAFIVLFGMFSLLLRERLYIGEAIWAFVFGIIIGPYCANVFNPRSWGGDDDESTNVITLEFTRVVLAIGVFAIGVELPKAYMARHWKSLFFLLVPVMTWGWFVSAAFIYALIPGLNFLSSLAVAACLTPTDPILAAAVVGGKWADKHVPSHIRHLLAAESGCNDGAAFPFLFLALYLMIDAPNIGTAVRDWFLLLWLYQVLMGAVIGCVLGFGFRHLMKYCEKHDLIDRHSYVAQYVSLAILTIGVCTLLGSDDLLAAFFCGTAFAWDGFFNKQTEESVFSSVIDTLFNVAAFIFVGAWMPFNKFQDEALTLSVWRLVVIAILVLVCRRLPIIIALYKWIPDIKTFREAIFSGHFGPIGIGAVFISTLAIEVLHNAHKEDDEQIKILMETIQPIVAFMVLTSILVHGLSVPSFSLGRRVHSVSRTWSRRDTLSGAPDWTNQARIVHRGEDIVINRDQPDLERGRVEFEKTTTELSVPETENEKRQDSEMSEDTRVEGTPAVATPHVRDIRREESPTLEETTYDEWLEGNKRVMERRVGPGSDPQVEVYDAPDASPGWTGAVQDMGRNALRRISSIGTNTRQETTPPTRTSSSEKMKAPERPPPPTSSSHPAVGDSAIATDDEEGWASEEGEDRIEPVTASSSSPSRPRPSSPSSPEASSRRKGFKHAKRAVHAVGSHWGKRRSSASARRPSLSQAEVEAADESRGREGRRPQVISTDYFGSPRSLHASSSYTHVGRPTTAGSSSQGQFVRGSRPGTADSSLRHHRVDNIRAMQATRENSPSRSVRFVERTISNGSGGNSGTASPRPTTAD
ncbi:hypothetical protein CVT24_000899 [Panaeolus cyanescens]|uniref:Cation/H+ exchanger transmembrane domain-containing protein n=1 Tax=Panaeolus cyanescens TaxID=181874 RepID=A0A409YY64_9AGAR|nr:hypothetical protein CVT24_000899 [Panaeolus cyanescens]